jgi:T5orf172 domain.
MPRLFLTKVWGFEPESYPALGFNSEGGRLKFLRESSPGDWVVLAGTLGRETNIDDQGRLLGKVQLGPENVDVEEVLRSVRYQIPENQYNRDGDYRWPFGLPLISAQRFSGKPDLSAVLGSYLSGTQWAAYALDVQEKLGTVAQAKLEALPTLPAKIVQAPAIIRQRERQRVFLLNRWATGPGPSTTRTATTRDAGEASVYLLELQSARDVFKIGYSADVEVRLATHNKPLLPSVTGYSWKLLTNLKFPREQQAYNFEQIVHNRLRRFLIDGEREIYRIERKDLDRVWGDVLYRADWAMMTAQPSFA